MVMCGPVQWRPLVPPELFSSMGLDLRQLNIDVRTTHWHWETLVDLLGNAFDGHSLLAAFLVALAHA